MLKRLGKVLSSITIFNFVIPLIMLYLIIGTVAQKYVGLYEATQNYFMAPYGFVWGFPVPGLPVLAAILTVNLFAHLLFKSPWHNRKAGIFIGHIGVVFLLGSGLFMSSVSQEGYLDLAEGQEKSFVSDFHIRELIITQTDAQGNETRRIIPFEDVLDRAHAALPPLPFKIEVLERCRNCQISKREDADESYLGMAQHMSLSSKAAAKQNEENMAGLTLRISGSNSDGVYTVLENVKILPQIEIVDDVFTIKIEKQKRDLPFTVRLLEFEKQSYPGTDMARGYQSRIQIIEGQAVWESVVAMNEPLRYKGYAIFQSSFEKTPEAVISVLSVVYNPVRTLPYIASFVLCFGIILHLFLKRPHISVRKTAWLVFLMAGSIALAMPRPASADDFHESLNVSEFAEIPVLHDGRLKPMDSFARTQLEFLSCTQSKANERMIMLLFNPDVVFDVPLICVDNAQTRSFMDLDKRSDNLYSYAEIDDALTRHKDVILNLLTQNSSTLTLAQKQLLNVYEKAVIFRDLTNSLSLFFPIQALKTSELPEDIRAGLEERANENSLSYVSTISAHQKIDKALKALIDQKGVNISSYSDEEQALSLLSFALAELRLRGEVSQGLKVIQSIDQKQRFAPWNIVLSGAGGPQSKQQFELWEELVLAYQMRDAQTWNDSVFALIQISRPSEYAATEIVYNRLHPFKVSAALYAVVFLVLLAGFVMNKSMDVPALLLMGAGAAVHIAAITARVLILSRPPVGTLYESILFAAAVMVVFCLWRFVKNKDQSWLWFGSIGGVILHIIGFVNDQSGDDSLSMLTAVLNTNFWLTTHVLSITAGYAFCIVTSLIAHGALYLRNFDGAIFHNMKRTALLALFFTTLGTILGGVWADQSWGRFWGWDPKENGALLIVLWLVWFIHADVTSSMKRPLLTAGFAYLSVVVGLSWFGVNLLSIGLHSYGFTDVMIWSLSGFAVLETLLTGYLLFRVSTKGHAA